MEPAEAAGTRGRPNDTFVAGTREGRPYNIQNAFPARSR
jgi:hypothetical protein